MGRSTFARVLLIVAVASAAASCVAPRPRTELPEPPLRVEENAQATEPSEPPEPESAPSALLVKAHNARRAKAGLPPLFENARLDAAAEVQARDMAGRGKMAHRGGDGSSPFDRIGRQGYQYRAAGENVAYGFDDVESVMTGWMKSPGHRRNILGQYSEIGVGRAIAKDGASYWCVTFGTPRTP